jgi:nucleotide-binding universal stress UspA family protein
VLTVGPHITKMDMARTDIAPVLFATDFSEGSEHALPYAVSVARANRTGLILLHAVPVSIGVMPGSMEGVVANVECAAELVSDALAGARRQMEQLLSAETAQELKPEIVIECADAAALILDTAENRRAGLIVMGAHRASMHSVAAHLPWATASYVVREAHCPVLTVRS